MTLKQALGVEPRTLFGKNIFVEETFTMNYHISRYYYLCFPTLFGEGIFKRIVLLNEEAANF